MSMLSLSQHLVPQGATDSIFPEIEEMFSDNSDLYNALKRIAPPTADEAYRSVMDWLYVSVHPEMRKACRKYYKDEGPPLKEIICEEDRLRAQARIIVLLMEAYQDFNKERERQWKRGSWTILCYVARLAA